MTVRAATTTLVTGPTRSGKSRHAEHLLAHHDDVTYVATGPVPSVADPEWADRVRRHRAQRPASWTTVETSDVVGVLAGARGPVLVDCLGTWLTALVDAAGWDDLDAARTAVRSAGADLVDALVGATVPVVVVTNEVGWSLVATTPAGRFFADELGRLGAAVSSVATAVHLVVAGRVLDLGGAPLVAAGPPDTRDTRDPGTPLDA